MVAVQTSPGTKVLTREHLRPSKENRISTGTRSGARINATVDLKTHLNFSVTFYPTQGVSRMKGHPTFADVPHLKGSISHVKTGSYENHPTKPDKQSHGQGLKRMFFVKANDFGQFFS